jgi:two-component system cell cycle response regulator DivK
MSLPLRQSDLTRQNFLSATAMLPPCVLVVDDHEESRTIARLVLERAGFRVAEASTGNEGLRLATALRPAAVLLDLIMPGLDGWELARQLHKNPATAGAAVIALTALAMPEDHDRALLAGCDAVLTKPVRPIRIVETVQEFVSPTRIAARIG